MKTATGNKTKKKTGKKKVDSPRAKFRTLDMWGVAYGDTLIRSTLTYSRVIAAFNRRTIADRGTLTKAKLRIARVEIKEVTK